MIILSKRHNFKVWTTAWSPDGTRLASAGFATVRIWDAATGKHVLGYSGHHLNVTALSWSPDSTCIASGDDDGTVQVWNAGTGFVVLSQHWNTHRAQAMLPVSAMAWSPDGRYIASAHKQEAYPVQVWDVTTGRQLYRLSEGPPLVCALAWSSGGKDQVRVGQEGIIMAASESASEWNLLMFRPIERVTRATWSPDCRYLALGKADGLISLWEYTTGTCLLQYRGHRDQVSALAWSRDGQHIASAGRDRTVQVWDATTGKQLSSYPGHTHAVTALAWSPDGAYITSCAGETTVHIWKPALS